MCLQQGLGSRWREAEEIIQRKQQVLLLTDLVEIMFYWMFFKPSYVQELSQSNWCTHLRLTLISLLSLPPLSPPTVWLFFICCVVSTVTPVALPSSISSIWRMYWGKQKHCPFPVLVVHWQSQFLCALSRAFIFPGDFIPGGRQNCIVRERRVGNTCW